MYHPALFKGMNVVVTGGGRGIGLEVARQFLDCGARVLVHMGRTIAADRPEFLDLAAAEGRAFLAAADFLAEGASRASPMSRGAASTASMSSSTMPARWSAVFRRPISPMSNTAWSCSSTRPRSWR